MQQQYCKTMDDQVINNHFGITPKVLLHQEDDQDYNVILLCLVCFEQIADQLRDIGDVIIHEMHELAKVGHTWSIKLTTLVTGYNDMLEELKLTI